jgi:Asp-tRNA(Asn)/Glu-tRNA(Gln) amidotransferase C subunit
MTDAGEGPVVIKENQLQEIAKLSRSEDTPKHTHIHICHISCVIDFFGLDLTHVCFLSVDQSQNVQRRGGEGRKNQVVVCLAIFEVVVCSSTIFSATSMMSPCVIAMLF